MNNVKVVDGSLVFEVDLNIYNDSVISKVLYWYSSDFVIYQKRDNTANIQFIEFKHKGGVADYSWEDLIVALNEKFIDYKNRQIVFEETKNLRDLYFAKAFANNDSFVEFEFKD